MVKGPKKKIGGFQKKMENKGKRGNFDGEQTGGLGERA